MKRLQNHPALAFICLNSVGHLVAFAVLAPHFLRLDRDQAALRDYLLYALISFVVVVFVHIVRLLATARLFPSKRHHKYAMILLESLVWMLLIVDAVLVSQQGVHLDSPSVVGAFAMNDLNFGVVIPLHLSILGIVVFALVVWIQGFLYPRADKLIASSLTRALHFPRLLLYFGLVSSGLFVLETQADFATVPSQAVPLYQTVVRLANGYPNLRLKQDSAKIQNLTMLKKPDILMILGESFRFDLVTPNISPFLYRLAKERGCFVPDKAYAGGHLTSIGAFTFLYGAESYLARPSFKIRRESPALKILRDNGYKIYGSDASGLPSYNPQVVQLEQFDFYDKHNQRHSAQNDIDAVNSLKGRLAETPIDQPVFGFLFLYATHFPYFVPENWPPLQGRPEDKGEYTQMFSDYQRSAGFVDQQSQLAFQAFQARAHERGLIVVFAGDHGEEFGERGGQGHAAVSFGDHRIRTPLIACFPKETTTKPIALAVNSDILPSIFQWTGLAEEKVNSLFSGKSFFSATPRGHAVISGAYFPTDGRDLAVISSDLKVRLNFAGAGPATSSIVVVANEQDKLLQEPPLAAVNSLLQQADQEFHRYLEVEGQVSPHATTREMTPSQH